MSGLKYSKEHEWVRVDGDVATVGISDYAQDQLGDVVYVELPAVGRTFAQGEQFGAVESVKAVSDLYCPVSGEVVSVNDTLAEHPETINRDPHGTWLIVVKLADAGELDALLDARDYGAHVA